MELTAANRIGKLRHLAHTRDRPCQFGTIELEPGHQRRRQLLGGSGLKIGLVGGQNGFTALL